jgi:LPXTG-site transpeptidase (sortase) family protein
MDNNDKPTIKKGRTYLHDEPNPAADLIRQKLETLYKKEPDAAQEAVESTVLKHRSKHQEYMHTLSTSGKPLAEVQTAWHEYYASLSDKEKHQVWQEFYAANKQQSALFKAQETVVQNNTQPSGAIVGAVEAAAEPATKRPARSGSRSVADIKKQITSKVRVRGKLSRKQHLKSLGFGLGMGALVVVILLFGFFNERFIAPFITPSRNVSATPLILDPNSTTVDPSPQVIIPKINVQAPVVYDVPTIQEADVQAGLERGIVHYITTSNPGEQGNAVFFGHSSSNILNRGKYKFAFVLLSWLNKDDTFYIQKDGVRYVYKIFDKKIVKPTDVSVLDPIPGKSSTATLITCDPPGTNVNRLIVVGEQISPDPGGNKTSSATTNDTTPKVLAGNSESLWHRFVNAIF